MAQKAMEYGLNSRNITKYDEKYCLNGPKGHGVKIKLT